MPSASAGPSHPHMDIDGDRENVINCLVDLMECDTPDPAQLTNNSTEPGPSGAVSTTTVPSSALAGSHPEPELDVLVSTVSETGQPVRRHRLPA